ncbi:MAG: autotransporter-associated beta strand repeat-containing protein, partial [Kiritimatiellaeota bacterium]|nr:autotransporter-associated beta strand repeat-containing protein [Kiritimatiellota bacterium]
TPTGGMTITNTGGALGTLTITQTVTSTYSGLIAGNVAVVKTGSGALALSGANTFGGGITLNAGTLNINNASALGTGTLVIAGGALDNTTAGAITNSRNNAMSWNGDFTAATTHSLNLGAGAVTLGSNRIVTVAANALTVGGVISDGGSNFGLTKAGNGTLVLTTNATYTGATIINTGTLQLAGGLNPLSPYSAIIPNAGILDLGGGTQFSTGAVAFTSGGGTIQNGTLSNDTAYTAQGGTIGISLAGAAGLTKTTTNALILSGSNTFSGGVTLNNGTLNINNGSALGTGVFTINGGVLDNTTAAALTNSQNNTQNWSSDFTFAGTRNLHLGTGAVTLGGGRIVTVSNNVLTIGGVISDGGSNFGLTKAGNGTLVLTTNATYTGATTINAGTLQLAGGLNPLSPFSTIFPNAGILDLGGGTQFSTGAIAFVGGTITNGSLSNNTAYTAQSGTISINLSGSAGLTKNGVGTLGLAGTNTYSGGTLLNAGVLQINSTNSLPVGIGNMTLSYGTTFAAGYQMGQSFLDRVSTASSGTVALAVSSTNALNFNTAGLTNVSLGAVGTVTNSGTLTPFGSAYRLGGGGGTLVITNALTDANNRLVAFSGGSGGTLQLSGVNTYSNTLILGGTVSFNADTALGNTAGASNIVMNGGTLNLSGVAMSLTRGIAIGTNGGTFTTTSGNLTLAGVIRNLPGQTGTVTIAGGNIVVVNNSSTYSGNTVLTGTVLVVVSKDSVGSGTNVTSGPFGIGTLVFAGAQIRNTTSGSGFTIGNNILFAADTTAPSAAGARNLTFSGEVTLTGTRMFTQAETSTITFSGPIGDNGLGYGFTKAGTGLLVLSGTNTYTGPTTISNGTLKVAFGGSLSSSTRVYVDPLGLLDLDGNSQTIAGLTGGGVVTNGGGNLTLNLASPNTFGGILKGASSLTLTGGGTLIMTGTNSFGSASVISNGSTYVVNGLHNGALITAYAGSTVGGNGPISGTLLVNGGIYQPGYGGVLTQTVATLTLTNSGTLAVTLAQTNNPAYVTVSSQLALAGTNNYLRLSNPDSLSFTAGTITLVDYHGTGVLDYTNNYFRLADNINTIVGPNDGWALTNNMQFSVVGGSSSVTNLFTINYDDLANGVITLTAVPEPGTASLLGLVGLAFLVRRLRHRGKA